MRCQDFQSQLIEGQKDSIDLCHSAALAEHLSNCPECRDIEQLLKGLDAMPQLDLPQGMSQRFQQRLAQELSNQRKPHPLLGSWWLPLSAAAILLISCGISLGYILRGGTPSGDPTMAKLQQGTPSDRMEAIARVSNRTTGPGDMVMALLDRVGHDPSLEVRLSAVEALYLFGSDPDLSHRIEVVLPGQDRPEVQLALIDLMAALRQRRAVEALRRLIHENRLPLEARQRAEQRLSQMML